MIDFISVKLFFYSCENPLCTFTGTWKAMSVHTLLKCRFRQVRCPQCFRQFPADMCFDHIQWCLPRKKFIKLNKDQSFSVRLDGKLLV